MPAVPDQKQTKTEPPKPTNFFPRSESVPEEIRKVVLYISGLSKSNRTGMPLRSLLKQQHLRLHFDPTAGILRRDSPLYQFYGDTRLFREAVWKFLAGGEHQQETT